MLLEFCVLLIAATNATGGDTQNTIDHTVLTPWDAFQLFDEDGSNSIDFEEFNALCDYCGLRKIDEKQRMKNFKRFDEDGGGSLSFEEFKLCWILMTNPFHQAAAHGFEVKQFDTEAEMREKVMHRLEKLEEKDQISLVDAFRWVDFHREKMRLEREARDNKIKSREYWASLPSKEWTMKLMIESLGKMGYNAAGKKEELEHRIRSYVNDANTFAAWLWAVVEAVLAMTDSGFESWGGVYTCGHGANGQLGRPCDATTLVEVATATATAATKFVEPATAPVGTLVEEQAVSAMAGGLTASGLAEAAAAAVMMVARAQLALLSRYTCRPFLSTVRKCAGRRALARCRQSRGADSAQPGRVAREGGSRRGARPMKKKENRRSIH